MSDFETGAGVKFSIGTTAAATDAASFGTDSYQEVANVESIPDFGDSSAEVSFISLGDGRKRKKKGSKDAGTITVPYAFLESDAGQAAMVAAEADGLGEYNFKVEFASGAIRYFKGQVASLTEGVGGADATLMVNSTIFINSAIVRVAAP